jgi:hypothetical protein
MLNFIPWPIMVAAITTVVGVIGYVVVRLEKP